MINVEEKRTKNVPGYTSLYVTFNYKSELVDIMKQFSGSYFNKKELYWEVPLCYLSDLIELCSGHDAIHIQFYEDEAEELIDFPIQDIENEKLLPHQIEAVKFGLQPNHKKWLLLDTMGLGKTYSAIALACNLHAQGLVNKVLIICGVNALKNNWKREIQHISSLPVKILGERINRKGKAVVGSIQQRLEQLQTEDDTFFTITNIETIRDDSIVKELLNPKSPNHFDMMIFDEIHHCVAHDSLQSKHMLKLQNVEYKLGLTGTLILNSPEDCYVPMKWIDAEKCGFTNYRYTFIQYDNNSPIPTGYHNLDLLKYNIARNSLRRVKDLLDLPPKTVINKYIDLEGKHQTFYNDIKKGIVDSVDKVHISTASILAMVTRLRQATVLPSILTTDNIPSCKLDYAEDLATQIMEQGDKVVIFSTFKEPVHELVKRLLKYNPVIGTGDIPDDVIATNITQFQNNPEIRCFIGTWQRCGTGITLTAATYMIFLDTAWTSAEYQQNQDRIYRIGTTKPVTIYNIICNDTIDEHVAELVERKEAVSDFIIDDKISETTFNSLKKYIIDLE